MKKLLYITDQEEYSENGTISTLFDIYLKDYWNVHIVYVTKYKNSFQKKSSHYIVPSEYQQDIIEYLEKNDVNIYEFDFVFVRNKRTVLKNVLKNKAIYEYKIAFRVSYPIKHHKLEYTNTFFPYSLVKAYQYKVKLEDRNALVNKCDLFLPSSVEAKDVFYSDIKIESFPIFTGLDPDMLNDHLISKNDITKFIYIGSLDKIRSFDTILDAFSEIKNQNWYLTISTTNKTYILNLLKNYPQLSNKISLVSAMSIKTLREQINKNDIGIALQPRNKFYDTILPDKVLDYYSCSLPTLLTVNKKNKSIFNEDEAFFSDFNVASIRAKISELIDLSSEDEAKVGNNGQKKLLTLKRNYKVLSQTLAQKLDEICEH